MVLFIIRAQLVYSAGEGSLHLFERLLLGGKAQVVGVDETVGGNWKWLVVGVQVVGIALSLVEGHFVCFAFYIVCHLVRL